MAEQQQTTEPAAERTETPPTMNDIVRSRTRLTAEEYHRKLFRLPEPEAQPDQPEGDPAA